MGLMNRIDEAVKKTEIVDFSDYEKKKKDLNLSLTIVETQLKTKKNVLVELEAEIIKLRSDRDMLATSIKKEKQELLNSIAQRESNVKRREDVCLETESNLRREQNFLEEARNNIKHREDEIESMKAEFRQNKGKLSELKSYIDGFLVNFK